MPWKDLERRRAYDRLWNARNRSKKRRSNDANKERVVQWFKEYKQTLSCIRCGEDHPACLQFHHRNPETKRIEVSVAVVSGWGIGTIT